MSDQSPVRVCAAMIVRDEAGNLPALLATATGLVDDWVVVDTGSTDGTVRVARSLGARVVEDPWDDDFARSRNLSLELAAEARPDWIVILDGDDRVEKPEALRASLEAAVGEVDVFVVQVESSVTPRGGGAAVSERFWQPRVFRGEAGVRYRWPVHAVPVLDGLRVSHAGGLIRHLGYAGPGLRAAKAARTLRMLGKLPPNEPHRVYHELRAQAVREDHAATIRAAELLSRLEVRVPPDASVFHARALIAVGRPTDALEIVVRALRSCPDHPDLHYVALMASGVGFLAGHRRIARDQGRFDGPVTTRHLLAAAPEALVQLGVLRREFLEHAEAILAGEDRD